MSEILLKEKRLNIGVGLPVEVILHAWDSPVFLAKLISNPKLALIDFGYNLPEDVEVDVHPDSKAKFNFTLPLAPSDLDELTKEELVQLALSSNGCNTGTCS